MVESLADHSVIIDKCKAVCESGCDSKEECERCPRTIHITRLLTLAIEPPVAFNVIGLTTEQAKNIEFTYNFTKSKVNMIFE